MNTKMTVASVEGGLKDNAIPVYTKAVIVCDDADQIKKSATEMQMIFSNEYATADPDVKIEVSQIQVTDIALMDEESSKKAICLLTGLPNGVQIMSMDIKDLVQTSLNMGIVKTLKDCLQISFCVRSSVDSEKEMVNRRIRTMMELLGGTMKIEGDYPGWEYKKDSGLRDLMIEIYKEQYNEEPKVEAIHAGLECGMFAGKIPGLDCVSIGPNLSQIHTVRESMNIPSVQRVYAFVLEILKRMKV